MTFNPKQLKTFPTGPGVYFMKNDAGSILYIGKAKNLKNRLKQYFAPGGDGRAMIPLLIAQTAAIETLIVRSEKEALLLENTLIKKHQPKYNALLKDDKSYVSLKITKHKWPMIQLVRYKGKPKADGTYFGPYTNAYSAKRLLELINKLFPLRRCSDREFMSRSRPCLLYQIKKCCAPCVNLVTHEDYSDHVARTIKFLQGKNKEILQELHTTMQKASEALKFEEAGAILKTIRAIEDTTEQQSVVTTQGQDRDVLGIHRVGPNVVLTRLLYRNGTLVGSKHHYFTEIAEDDADLTASFLLQTYTQATDAPHEILIPVFLPNADLLAEIISVRLHYPQRGQKRELIDMAATNAEAAYKKQRNEEAIKETVLLEMQDRFKLHNYPRHIECFDTSNLAGSHPVATAVTFKNGLRDSSGYRKYKIRSTQIPDDYSAMKEVLSRRFAKKKTDNHLPDLIIVDGGKGQLNIALKALRELDIVSVDVIALVKEKARHDKGLTAERVFLANKKSPVALKRTSAILFLLQNIRDEAHRFAITFHRQLRSKEIISSSLDTIPGIGPKKKKRLLIHFGSAKKIREATREELLEVPGISQGNVDAIIQFYG